MRVYFYWMKFFSLLKLYADVWANFSTQCIKSAQADITFEGISSYCTGSIFIIIQQRFFHAVILLFDSYRSIKRGLFTKELFIEYCHGLIFSAILQTEFCANTEVTHVPPSNVFLTK